MEFDCNVPSRSQLYFWNLPPTVLKMHPPVGTHDTDDEICNGDADLDENIVIPGAAANGTIIITLVQRSATGASNAVDTFIGQTFIVMRNIYAYEGRAAAQRWYVPRHTMSQTNTSVSLSYRCVLFLAGFKCLSPSCSTASWTRMAVTFRCANFRIWTRQIAAA